MESGCLMRFGDCRCVDIFKPVVRRYRAGVMQDETAERKVDIGILVHPPIAFTQVAVHRFVDIDHQPLRIADSLPFCTVEDEGLCDFCFIAFDQNIFDNILNFLDCGNRMSMARSHQLCQFLFHCSRQRIGLFFIYRTGNRLDCFLNRYLYFIPIKDFNIARPLYYRPQYRLCFYCCVS